MLSLKEVTTRAIRWYVLAELATLNDESSEKQAAVYCKASAYLSVLALPYSKQCGKNCEESLREYAKKIAEAYHLQRKILEGIDVSIGEYMDRVISITKYKE